MRKNLAQINNGLDPVDERKRLAKDIKAKAQTFQHILSKALQNLIDPSWNAKHISQWKNGFDKYVVPKIGSSLIQKITR